MFKEWKKLAGKPLRIIDIIMMYFFYAWHQLTKLSPTFGWKENIFGKEPAAKVSEEVAKEAFR